MSNHEEEEPMEARLRALEERVMTLEALVAAQASQPAPPAPWPPTPFPLLAGAFAYQRARRQGTA